jgi:hypothetical protein
MRLQRGDATDRRHLRLEPAPDSGLITRLTLMPQGQHFDAVRASHDSIESDVPRPAVRDDQLSQAAVDGTANIGMARENLDRLDDQPRCLGCSLPILGGEKGEQSIEIV